MFLFPLSGCFVLSSILKISYSFCLLGFPEASTSFPSVTRSSEYSSCNFSVTTGSSVFSFYLTTGSSICSLSLLKKLSLLLSAFQYMQQLIPVLLFGHWHLTLIPINWWYPFYWIFNKHQYVSFLNEQTNET